MSILAGVNGIVPEIAAEVIRTASREKPADAALREVLKSLRRLPPFDAAAVSRAVFTYYRWLGWTREERGVPARIRQAERLAERFKDRPESFPATELRAAAVPDWTAAEMEISINWLRSLQREPKLWLRSRRGKTISLTAMPGCVAGPLAEAFLYEGEADLFRTPAFHAGDFEIQDITSQAVGWLCAPKPGETWWDACAGEGGKTLHLSGLMENKGLIWASDRAAWRLQRLKRRAARAGVFNYRAAAWDGGARLPTKTKFDGVLIDAPCSGIGTWQRNPHARWTTTPNDVAELSAVQMRLLEHAAVAVKPGGKLIYAVCTLTRAETVAVADFVGNRFNAFEPLPVPSPLQPGSTPAARLWLWPQDTGGNGMFVAVWRKKG